MIKLADEFVPDPAQRLLVAVTETASMLIQRAREVLTVLNDQSRQVSNRRVLRTRRINTARLLLQALVMGAVPG